MSGDMQSAIGILQDVQQYFLKQDPTEMDVEIYEVYGLAITAMQKRVPMKPDETSEPKLDMIGRYYEMEWLTCPVCRKEVSDGQGYCVDCGQAIDWSADDGKS